MLEDGEATSRFFLNEIIDYSVFILFHTRNTLLVFSIRAIISSSCAICLPDYVHIIALNYHCQICDCDVSMTITIESFIHV